MSTRRARIKAVAALPVRRKNADNKKLEQNESKEHCEENICSPNTSKSSVIKNHEDEKTSPANKNYHCLPKSPREQLRSSCEVPKTPKHDKTPSPSPRIPTPVLKAMHKSPQKTIVKNDNFSATPRHREFSSPAAKPSTTVEVEVGNNSKNTTKFSEKVPVITSTSQYNKNRSLFASPLSRIDVPDKKHIMSPVVPSPSIPSKQIDNVKAPTHQTQKAVSTESEKIGYTQNLEKQNDVTQDYNPPSVPESITDEGMDGIVPLQPTRSVPKPIDILKNEIISENAEVLFDPIVPLPSPSKVRPKLKPVPRLAPFRRNSIQGSASESEDENRRALLGAPTSTPARQRHDSHTSHGTLHSGPNRETNRNRNDSICSSVSQVAAQPPFASSPLKDKYNLSKSRRQEMMNRRMAAMRRRRETVKRDALTMYDLIFYNPSTNPIVPDQDEMKAKEANARDAAEASAKEVSQVEEQKVDDPPAATPVPQIKLGPNGEIILDETSLVIKQTEGSRKLSAAVVREGAWGGAGGPGGRYSRAPRTADWSPDETVRFYRALAAVGTDFSLMAPLFPDRNRRDLKLKFKKEEKLNGAQVDKALRSATAWDVVRLQKEFEEERESAAKRAAAERDRLTQQKEAERERLRIGRKMRMRRSRGSKAIEAVAEADVITSNEVEPPTADGLIKRALAAKERKKQRAKDVVNIERTGNSENATPQFATLTVINKGNPAQKAVHSADMAIATLPRASITPSLPINSVSDDIETGSLVVLTVNDPKSPSKQMFQTYISHGEGKLTPVALPPNLLNSVLGYMKKGTPKSNVSSPQLTSPNSVTSNSGRTSCATPSVIQVNPSPAKKMRDSPYNITQL